MVTDKIPHAEANVKIFFTRDYTRFKAINGNRLLNESKIKRMIRDIESGLDMLRYCPIVVDKDMNVIDGQHRLFVARKLKSNIWYVITDDLTLHEIAKLNSNQERWKAKDFIHCYSAQGIKDYDILNDFLEKYQWPISLAISVIGEGKTREGGNAIRPKERFERGEFKAIHLDKAIALADCIDMFQSFEGFQNRPFINAVASIIDAGKCDMKILAEKVAANTEMLSKSNNLKGYQVELEAIYNKNLQKRKTIF